jgi:hypothetical protein
MTIYGKSEKTKRVILWIVLFVFGMFLMLEGFWYIAVPYWMIVNTLFVLDYIKKKKNRI